jgi:hypothetical protein
VKRKLALLLAGLLASSAIGLAGVASAGQLAPTRVTIRGPNGDFSGKIFSDATSCLGNRTVRLFMAESAGGPFERIATDTSQRVGDRGEWSAGNTGFRDGFFQARVLKTTACRGARSRILELVDGQPQ